MFMFKKKLAKLITAAMLMTVPAVAMTPAKADANWISAAINVGVAGYQMSQYNKEIDKLNNTEEGRQSLFNSMKEKQGVNH